MRKPSFRLAAFAAASLLASCQKGAMSPVGATVTKDSGQASASLPKIEIETFKLANGLNVILHVDDKMPAVNVNLWYHVGSKDERTGRTGLAHLFEHMMFQGSKNVKGEYLTLIERAGASLRTGGVNGTTDTDRTNYFETVPTSSLEYALWLESDRMGFLLDTLDQKNLDNQRSVVENEKRQGDNRPYAEQRYIVAEQMYPAGHPYAHSVIGSMEDLRAASLDDVKDFFRKYYAPNNASLTLSGNFDKAEAKALVSKYFGPLPAGEAITRPKVLVPVLEEDKLVVRQERVPQAKLTLVWHTPQYFHPDEAALDFLGEVLGEGKNSRLYKRLVRDEKLASKLAVYNSGSEISGLFFIEVLLSPGASVDKVKAALEAELKKVVETGPSDIELAQRKAASEYRFVTQLERLGGFGGKADRLNRYYTFLGRADAFKEDFDRYANVSKADVMRVARDWLASRKRLEIQFLPDSSGRADQPEFDRSKEPSMAGKIPFSLPVIEKRTLANGLEVYVSNRPSLPKVEVALILKRVDVGETEQTAGTSYLTAMTVTEGTKTRSADQIQSELDSLGADLVTEGSKFGSAVALSTLKKHLEPSLDVLADVAMNPIFPEAEVELAKKLRLDQILQEASNPAQLASELFPRILFAGGHPGGIPDKGTESSVAAVKPADLQKNHAAFWAPNNAALLLVGDVTAEQAERLAQQYFSSWQPKELAKVEVKPQGLPAKPYVFLVDAQGAPQSQIRIGSLAPTRLEAGYVPLQVMNGVLGGTFSSRLNQNLREDKGYAYGAYSGFSQNQFFGFWTASAGVQTAATVASLTEFKKEIEGLAGTLEVSEEELAGLKKNLSRSYLQNFETLNQIIRQVAPLITAGVPLDFLSSYIPDVLKETPDSVMATAKTHLDFDRSIVLVVGDLAAIEQPILALGWGDVLVLNKEGRLIRRGGEAAKPAAPAAPEPPAPIPPNP